MADLICDQFNVKKQKGEDKLPGFFRYRPNISKNSLIEIFSPIPIKMPDKNAR